MLINAYNIKSKSACQIADYLHIPMLGRDVQMCGFANIGVINWGAGEAYIPAKVVLNKPECIRSAVNKLASFKLFKEHGVRTPLWTTSWKQAAIWSTEGTRIVTRKRLEGRDGEGVVMNKVGGPVEEGKLYTQFIAGCDEYRVTVIDGHAYAVQKKVRVPGKASYNDEIKTTGGGYGMHLMALYEAPTSVREEAIKAVKALGLDFGGVDVIHNPMSGAYILEVNTAPELTPHLLEVYAGALKTVIKRRLEAKSNGG